MTLIDTPPTDAELVASTLAGNRRAFGKIVERYQRLLCSLAYSATGDLAESEDIAQEAFVEAWRELASLREPEKLRSWLCGILRHRVGRSRRKGRRNPVTGADELQTADEPAAEGEGVADATIRAEEQAIMWNALGQLPDNYREPLILYYREHRSVEHVAVELDLTEDTVKQRLSRGRKMLKEQALAFVEGALARSTPGKVFTIGVLAALPALSPPAKAAGIGAAAMAAGKSVSSAAKLTALAALLASVSGLISSVVTLQMNLEQSRTKRERRAVVIMATSMAGSFLAFIAVLFLARTWAMRAPEHLAAIVSVVHVVIVLFGVGWSWLLIRQMRAMRELRADQRRRHPEQFRDERDQVGSAASEYRSAATLFGVPLVHIRFGMEEVGQPPAFGWIAGGDRAIGLLAAYGGWSVGFFSMGAVSAGVVSFGAVSVGLLSMGAICVGAWALGAVAIGNNAVGSLSATAWETAQGVSFTVSQWVAAGPLALAPHVNDDVARQALANPHGERDWLIYCIIVVILALVPTSIYAKVVRRRMGGKRSGPDAS